MSNYYQLFKKGEKEASKLCDIDVELCKLLDKPVHPNDWCCNWHNILGFKLAMGTKLEDLEKKVLECVEMLPIPVLSEGEHTEEELEKHKREMSYVEFRNKEIGDLVKICRYLCENYTSDAWAQIGNPR